MTSSYPSDSPPLRMFGNRIRLDKYSYKVDNISNQFEIRANATRWSFTVSVVTSFENAKRLAIDLEQRDSKRFQDITVRTSRYAAIGLREDPLAPPRAQPLSEMLFVVDVYTSNADWIAGGAEETTPESILGFSMVGENLSYEEIVELLVEQRAPEKKPYRPEYVRPGTEIGYVSMPPPPPVLQTNAEELWGVNGSGWDAYQKKRRDVLEQAAKQPEAEKQPKNQPSKGRVIRQRGEEETAQASPRSSIRRVIKRRR